MLIRLRQLVKRVGRAEYVGEVDEFNRLNFPDISSNFSLTLVRRRSACYTGEHFPVESR